MCCMCMGGMQSFVCCILFIFYFIETYTRRLRLLHCVSMLCLCMQTFVLKTLEDSWINEALTAVSKEWNKCWDRKPKDSYFEILHALNLKYKRLWGAVFKQIINVEEHKDVVCAVPCGTKMWLKWKDKQLLPRASEKNKQHNIDWDKVVL